MKTLIGLLVSFCMIVGVALADSIEVIQLQNRLAEEIIPVIEPMLGSEDAISGKGFQLFIRTSNDDLEQIRQMIDQLDSAARLLLISVFQGDESDLRSLAVTADLTYQGSNSDIHLGKSMPSSGDAGIRYSTRNAALGIEARSTHRRLSDIPLHQLRITEGTQGYIETGESIPYFSGGYWRHGRGHPPHTIYGGIEYKDIMTGFYVLPRVHGELVSMVVSPYKQTRSRQQSDAFETSGANTQITGPLGQWLQIGGVTEQIHQDHKELTSVISTRGRESQGIWIKAELVQ